MLTKICYLKANIGLLNKEIDEINRQIDNLKSDLSELCANAIKEDKVLSAAVWLVSSDLDKITLQTDIDNIPTLRQYLDITWNHNRFPLIWNEEKDSVIYLTVDDGLLFIDFHDDSKFNIIEFIKDFAIKIDNSDLALAWLHTTLSVKDAQNKADKIKEVLDLFKVNHGEDHKA